MDTFANTKTMRCFHGNHKYRFCNEGVKALEFAALHGLDMASSYFKKKDEHLMSFGNEKKKIARELSDFPL